MSREMTAPTDWIVDGAAYRNIPIETYGRDFFNTPQATLNSSTANRLLDASPDHAHWFHCEHAHYGRALALSCARQHAEKEAVA